MPNLNELIDQMSNGDPDETASAVFDALGCPQKWRDMFGPLVRNECRRSIRSDVRAHENSPSDHGTSDTQERRVAGGINRAEYLADRFCIGRGKHVVWGEATVQDHRDRIAFLASLRNGIDNTIARHAEAIDIIEAAGVSCLNDVLAVAA